MYSVTTDEFSYNMIVAKDLDNDERAERIVKVASMRFNNFSENYQIIIDDLINKYGKPWKVYASSLGKNIDWCPDFEMDDEGRKKCSNNGARVRYYADEGLLMMQDLRYLKMPIRFKE